MTKQEKQLLELVFTLSEEEKCAVIRFTESILNGLEVTSEEAYEMGRRMASQIANQQ